MFGEIVTCFCLVLFFLINEKVACSRSVAVHLDTRYSFSQLDPQSHQGRQCLMLKSGSLDLVCCDVSLKATRFTPSKNADVYFTSQNYSGWSHIDQTWTLESQIKRQLVNSKVISLEGECFVVHNAFIKNYVFDICIRRSVGQYEKESLITYKKSRIYEEIGVYNPYLDEVYENGTVVQYYVGMELDQSIKVLMNCGMNETVRVNSIQQTGVKSYFIEIEGPSFCDWRKQHNTTLYGYNLLHGLNGWCSDYTINATSTFTYCFPDLLQMYTNTTGEINSTTFLGSEDNVVLQDFLKKKSLLDQEILKERSSFVSNYTREKKDFKEWPPYPIRREKLTKMIFDLNLNVTRSVLGESLEAFVMEIQSTRLCGSHFNALQFCKALIYFYCPDFVLHNPTSRIQHFRQLSESTFEVYIFTAFVCSHPALLPRPLALPETVTCYAAFNKTKETKHVVKKKENPKIQKHFVSEVTPMSFDLLRTILENSIDYVGHLKKKTMYLSSSIILERVPSRYFLGFYATGLYERRRERDEPLYFVGLPVRHIRLNVTGVIIGWDAYGSIANDRYEDYELNYSLDPLSLPHYLIYLSKHYFFNSTEEHYLYSPQSFLEPLNITKTENFIFDHPFFRYNPRLKVFQINSSKPVYDTTFFINRESHAMTLASLYPDDDMYSQFFFLLNLLN